MEALWKIESKWKLTTKEAILIFTCISILLILSCIFATLRRILSAKNKPKQQHVMIDNQDDRFCAVFSTKWSETRGGCRWDTVKRVLISSVRWSGPNREKRLSGIPLLGSSLKGWKCGNKFGSPVWQRPILMGEKCELPKFSGLILYDVKGLPLDNSVKSNTFFEVNKYDVGRTTLKDLL